MIGIYKIVSPTGKVYIGQSIDTERRLQEYVNSNKSKGQPKLHRSLVKYGFSEHIFEVIEECSVEELNTRERYWQEYYDVLKEGLNCLLTKAGNRSGKMSKESIARRVASTDFADLKRLEKIKNNTDYAARTANTDYTSFQDKRVANTDYKAIAEKNKKPLLQFSKDGIFIGKWTSVKEAGETLHISRGNISSCCTGVLKSAGGFIWRYVNI